MALLLAPLTPVTDNTGAIRPDAVVHVYEAGTTQPASIYMDAAFNIPAANPIPASGGRVPPIYVNHGIYRIRALSLAGEELCDFDNLDIDAPTTSGGGGGGGSVDPNALWQTGDIKHRYAQAGHPGWVRLNGRTIGPVGSGATERQDDDTEALYIHLWNTDADLAVVGARGATAEADWAAAKPLTLPDARGRVLLSLDNLGATAAGRLAGGKFDFGTATQLGGYGGEASHLLSINQLPAHTHTATGTSASAGGHDHTGTTANAGGHTHTITVAGSGVHTHSGTTANGGGHTHTINLDAAGLHDHTASTSSAGAHDHTYQKAQFINGTAGSGATNTNIWYGANANTATSNDGNHTHPVTVQNAGTHTHTGSTDNPGPHDHAFSIASSGTHSHTATASNDGSHDHTFTTAVNGAHVHPITVSVTNTGGGIAFNSLPPFLLITTYIKL